MVCQWFFGGRERTVYVTYFKWVFQILISSSSSATMVPKSSQIFWSGNPSSQLAGYTSMKTSLAAICQDINPKISTIGTKLIRIHMSEVKCHLHLCSEALPDFLVGHHRWTQSTQIPSHKGMTQDDTWICHSSRQRSRKSNSNFTKSIAPVTCSYVTMRIGWYHVTNSIPKKIFRILESSGNNMKQTLSKDQWVNLPHPGSGILSMWGLKLRRVTLTTPVVMRMLGSKFDKWASMAVAKHSSELWGVFLGFSKCDILTSSEVSGSL